MRPQRDELDDVGARNVELLFALFERDVILSKENAKREARLRQRTRWDSRTRQALYRELRQLGLARRVPLSRCRHTRRFPAVRPPMRRRATRCVASSRGDPSPADDDPLARSRCPLRGPDWFVF